MTARRKLRDHMRQLSEIRDIMDAMKNLAFLETHKLGNLLENQQVLIGDLERIAGEFLKFFPYPALSEKQADCWIIFGAERGFCGDFNDVLLDRLETELSQASGPHLLVAVGTKLQMKLADDSRAATFIEGADVAEEITPVLNQLIVQLGLLQGGQLPSSVNVLYQDAATERVEMRRLMPPLAGAKQPESQSGYPPILNLDPDVFFSALLDRYLFVALQDIAYTSLMAENQKRIQHMTGAVHHLDETAAELMRRYHMRRQEDITEEIEVILLNATREFE